MVSSQPTATRSSKNRDLTSFLMPTRFTRWTMILAVVSLLSQAGIIVTGAAVRLTGSGLGCSEWPRCSPESYVATPELGIHGAIEFGNRTLTFILTAIAVLMLVAIWKMRKTHTSIFVISWVLLAVIPGQAFVGGITVWTGLNPWVVSGHFLLSALMVGFASVLVNRVRLHRRLELGLSTETNLVDGETSKVSRTMAWLAFLLGTIVVILGTVVTGSGPHGGDDAAARHDYFDQLLVTRLHAFPVYAMTIAAIILAVVVFRMASSQLQRSSTLWLLAVIVFQALIGFYQHFNGLPIVAVLGHMIGSGFTIWAMTNAWDRQVSSYRADIQQVAPSETVATTGSEALANA